MGECTAHVRFRGKVNTQSAPRSAQLNRAQIALAARLYIAAEARTKRLKGFMASHQNRVKIGTPVIVLAPRQPRIALGGGPYVNWLVERCKNQVKVSS